MRKNKNDVRIEGYVYQLGDGRREWTKLDNKVSKKGVPYIGGQLQIATDEDGLNIVTVNFPYFVEERVSKKTGKPYKDRTYAALQKIVNCRETGSWVCAGKENALKVVIENCTVSLNEYYNQDGELSAFRQIDAGIITRITFIDELTQEQNKARFNLDFLIEKTPIEREADPEVPGSVNSLIVSGAAFNWRNELLPMTLVIKNPEGISYLLSKDIRVDNKYYGEFHGTIVNKTVVSTQEVDNENGWGEKSVTSSAHRESEWLVTGMNGFDYPFGEEDVMTEDELKALVANRELHLATIKQEQDARAAAKAVTQQVETPQAAPTTLNINSSKDWSF